MTVGGIAAAPLGPLAVPLGAYVGGAGGEAARQLLSPDVPPTAAERASSIATQGLVGAASEIIPPALGKLVAPLKASAIRSYQSALSPTTLVNKSKAAKVIPGLIERNVISGSSKGLEKRLASETAKAEVVRGGVEKGMIAAEAAGKPKNIDSEALLVSLNKYRDKMLVPGTRPIIVGNQPGLSAIDAQINKLAELTATQGRYLSKESAIGLLRILDESVVSSKQGAYVGADMAQKSIAKAERHFANALRRELAAKEPEFAKVNAEFSFWKNGLDVIKATNKRRMGQSGVVGRVLGVGGLGSGGGALAYALGGSYRESAGVAVVLGALARVMQTTAWKTTSAVTKDGIADALSAGNMPAAMKLIGRIGASRVLQP